MNRQSFLSVFENLKDKREKYLEKAGVLYVEIDEPARFNDMLMFDADERIMSNFEDKIASITDKKMLARKGQHNFVIIVDNFSVEKDLENLARNIIHIFREPMDLDGNLVYVTGSVGISFSENPINDMSIRKLVRQAEQTMKEARLKGFNQISVFRGPAPDFSCEQELRLMKDLPKSIDKSEIYFVYQAQYSYSKQAFIGAEILARWKHPELGDISPSVFIPFAEKSGMITPLTTRILIEASVIFSKLENIGIDDFSISVNLPFQVLMEESFIDTVKFLLDAYELGGKKVTFEIMEDTIPDHIESFTLRLQEIKKLGFLLAVDDYGTGHTSLTYLLHFPVDYLKVDRSFVKDIHKNKRNYLLFKSIISTAEALELDIVAEGVETIEEDRVLKSFGDITVQGYLYSKPLEESSFLQMLSNNAV